LTSPANKKVFVTRFERETVHGFVQTPDSFTPMALDLLTPAGSLLKLPYAEIKVVSFVRDFENGDNWRTHRSFASRPKTPGLWVRLIFRDEDTTEGVMANNLILLEEAGLYMIPPDPTFQNHRIFVPRLALREAQVLGVVGNRPVTRGKAQTKQKPTTGQDQLEMFP